MLSQLKIERDKQNESVTLPDFLIIGAAKSATTWLVHCLMSHPDIFVHEKEIFYFSRYYSKGLEWYGRHFQNVTTESLVGENSNGYLPSEDAPVRIKKLIPEVKLIACLRNPVDRAYSSYCMKLRRGLVTDDIESYLSPQGVHDEQKDDLLRGGNYVKFIKRYLNHFDRSRLQVMIYDDLQENPRRYIETICDFLEVDAGKLRFDLDRRINPRAAEHYPKWFSRLLISLEKNRSVTYRFLNSLLTIPAVKDFRDMMKNRTFHYPPLSDELRSRLVDHYTESVTELEDLIGRDLGEWKKRAE